MKIDSIPINWFDLVVLIVIGVGIFRGRSRGMSGELLDVLKWLLVVVLGALIYRPVGQFVASYTHITPLSGFLLAYISFLIGVRLFFGWLKRMVGEKLLGADVFGAWEYYLGMVAGAMRFACFIVIGLAFLNAIYVSPEQLAAEARMQKENFGDISFPTVGSLQQNIFHGSASGKFVKLYLADELIVSTPSDRKSTPGETLGRRRERAVYEVLGEKK